MHSSRPGLNRLETILQQLDAVQKRWRDIQLRACVRVLCSDWMPLVVCDCSSSAVTTWSGATNAYQHIDYGTSGSCRLKTQSWTWPYCPCVSIPSSLSARSAGGQPGLPTAPPSTTRTGHAPVRHFPPPQVTPIISCLDGFHCDNSVPCARQDLKTLSHRPSGRCLTDSRMFRSFMLMNIMGVAWIIHRVVHAVHAWYDFPRGKHGGTDAHEYKK